MFGFDEPDGLAQCQVADKGMWDVATCELEPGDFFATVVSASSDAIHP